MAHDVFICYSTKDKPAADAVCATLESRAIRCWIAPRDILPGMEWSSAIIDGISESQLLVLVFSSNANDSPQIKRELERAVNRSLPIIPFRIENVPLSKPLEYFISTPHWLDALTPPMEKHLNYLAETVEVLLKRKGMDQMIPPIPTPRQSDSRGILWAAIAIAAAVLIAGGAFLFSKLRPDPQEQQIAVEQSGEPDDSQAVPIEKESVADKENPDSPQSIEPDGSLDPQLAGTWFTNPIVDGKKWKLKLRIQRNSTFDFSGTFRDGGSYVAQAGRWESRTTNGQTDSGTYAILNPNMATIAGRFGTGIWTRVRKRSVGANSRVDPAMVGSWQTTAVIDGKEFTFVFDVNPAGTFESTTSTADRGRFEAKGGKFRQVSKNGTIVQGTYQMHSPNTVTLTGPAGPAVWTR